MGEVQVKSQMINIVWAADDIKAGQKIERSQVKESPVWEVTAPVDALISIKSVVGKVAKRSITGGAIVSQHAVRQSNVWDIVQLFGSREDITFNIPSKNPLALAPS